MRKDVRKFFKSIIRHKSGGTLYDEGFKPASPPDPYTMAWVEHDYRKLLTPFDHHPYRFPLNLEREWKEAVRWGVVNPATHPFFL